MIARLKQNHIWGRALGAMAVTACMLLLLQAGCATLGGSQDAVLRAKDKVAPALVHIRPVKEVFVAGKRTEVITIGSGFIISPDGYVVTNEHVAGESSLVLCVLSDNTEKEARVVGVDVETDIAVLKLEHDTPLPYVKLGRSDTLQAGQMVLAMGSPHGLARSVSLGIVSVTDRFLPEGGALTSPFNTWIQTDAAINPGNSGGPLVNLRGEVIGINARVLGGADNVGFAIPVDTAREVIDAVIRDGRVKRSWLGLDLQEMTAKTNDPARKGVVIAGVAPLSPAQENGSVRPGDVLIALNETPVHARYEEDLPAVRKRIASLPVGEPVTLLLERGSETLEVSLVTEEYVSLKGGQAEFTEWGFTATEVTPEVARRAQLPVRAGVMVLGALPGGRAGQAGLAQGDIILEVDGEPIRDLQHLRERYDALLENSNPLVMLFVKQGALTRFVLVHTQTSAPAEIDEEILEYVE